MKKTYYLMALAALTAWMSCQKTEADRTPSVKDPVFTASIEDTKTSITPADGKVAWDGDEEITITDASNVSVVYVVESVADGKATFVKKAGEVGTLGAGPYTAVYGDPLPTMQIYGGTVKDLPMTASSATTNLSFSVSCGLLRITLTKAGTSISSVAVGDGTNVYTLTCSPAVDISSGADFCIAVPAGTYKRFAFQKSDGKYCVKTAKSGSETGVAANQIQPINFSSFNFNTTLVHNITELNAALTGVADGDKILLASGTYALSSTISITNAITLEGGYSASPSAADFSDPVSVKATFDGNNAVRVMNISGSGKNVSLSGIVIQNGKTSANNEHGAGVLVTNGASVAMDNCAFRSNTSGAAGGGLMINNTTTTTTTTTISNSEFYGNTSSQRGGAIELYGSASSTSSSKLVIVNCTLANNTAVSYGSAIAVISNANNTVKAEIASCTITANTATSSNVNYGGAVSVEQKGTTTVNLRNTILSGNTFAANTDYSDLKVAGGTANKYRSIVGETTHNGTNTIDTPGAFNAATMLLAKTGDGIGDNLTRVYKLLGNSSTNSAITNGYSQVALAGTVATNSGIDSNLLIQDQWGNPRGSGTEYNRMGAYVAD